MFPALLVSAMQFSSCNGNKLHIHNYEWKHNEETHWQECSVCHKKIGETEHQIDMTDRCIICDYHDPIVKTNGSATITGLTKHGQKKSDIYVDKSKLYISSRAFSGSDCTKVHITDDFIGFDDDAFDDSHITSKEHIVDPDEQFVDWFYWDGAYYRDDHIKLNECMIRNGEETKYYPTLRDAIEDPGNNDVTITLLQDSITLDGKPYYVNHKITLEALKGTCTIEGASNSPFYIQSSAFLRVPKGINYTSDTHLVMGKIDEKHGDYGSEHVYTSGSLIFSNYQYTETPPTLSVDYVDDSKEHVKHFNARVSKQSTGSGLSQVPNYAYGVFKMSTDLKEIKGLTDFGEQCTSLCVCNPIDDDNYQSFNIGKAAFTIKGFINIPIPLLPDPHVNLWRQKGIYTNLEIGEGINEIGMQAFANYIASDLSIELRTQIAYLLSPITNLKISNDVKIIHNGAFTECISLDSVIVGSDGGSQLEKIRDNAFSNCLLLKSANFANCRKLKTIEWKAFWGSSELETVDLPSPTTGWRTQDGFSYLPEDMTPQKTAKYLRTTHAGKTFYHDLNYDEVKFAWANKSDTDLKGNFNKVHYCKDFPSENDYKDEATIFVFDEAGDVQLWSDKTISKSVNIVVYNEESTKNITIGNTTISKNKYLKISKKINIAQGSSILLLNDNDETNFKNMSGFAKEVASRTETVDGIVNYAIKDGGIIQANHSYATIKNKTYCAYGLFNFKHTEGSKLVIDGGGNGLSNLGKLASMVQISKLSFSGDYTTEIGEKSFQYYSGNLEKIEIDDSIGFIRNWAFEECKHLKEVKIGKNVEWLGERSFRNCKELEKVEFVDNTVLNAIYKQSFDGCSALKSVVLSTGISTGWKIDGTQTSVDLSDPAKAAELLSKTYKDKILKRS